MRQFRQSSKFFGSYLTHLFFLMLWRVQVFLKRGNVVI
ncbi:hypothetical protein NBRC111894_1104 [Sporolactobacillus inulinus]|uniref:Uncharacterized protein n=1 Tax=Sporolactobacillus inulinus TaxID=2078 RepID=A0A4Y1Z964_9BACL|nr:hypothetical protein NBRC111894_1104 [Sporolactobacillus inulinus]